jgi:hypothetical protein
VSKSFRVYVRDSACPIKLNTMSASPGWKPSTYTASLVASHGAQVCAVARYALAYPVGDGLVTLDNRGKLVVVVGSPQLSDSARKSVEEVLSVDWPYRVEVEFWDHSTRVYLYLNSVPWSSNGSERATLSYSPYWFEPDPYFSAPVSHWYTTIESVEAEL